MTYDLVCSDGHYNYSLHGTQGKMGNIPVDPPPCQKLLDDGKPCAKPTEVVNVREV
jgi:hypothetical protein